MEIGGKPLVRRLAGFVGFVGVVLAVLGVFVYLFFLFTGMWRVAFGVGGTMVGFMILMAWLVERGGSNRGDTMS
jgi:hypothetical protein